MSEWNVLQAQYNGISDNISNYVDQVNIIYLLTNIIYNRLGYITWATRYNMTVHSV